MSRPLRIKKMSLYNALSRYYATTSVHKRGHQQEFYRVCVIQRHPVAQKMMDEITTVDIAAYRDFRLSQINVRTGRNISGNTVRLELALLSSLYNLARVEWGTCRTNPVELVRKPKVAGGRDRRLTSQEERRLSRYFREQNPELYTIFHLAIETAMRQGDYVQGVVLHDDVYKPVLGRLCKNARGAPHMTLNEITPDGLKPLGYGNPINNDTGSFNDYVFRLNNEPQRLYAQGLEPEKRPAALQQQLGFDSAPVAPDQLVVRREPESGHRHTPTMPRPGH